MVKRISIALAVALSLVIMLAGCGTAQTSTKTGVLVEASMHVVSIQAPDGTTYVFGVDDTTDVQGSERLGNTMQISYNGEYTPNMIATAVKTTKEAETPTVSAAPKATTNPAEAIWYVTGVVLDASMHNIKIQNDGGHVYTVLKDDNTKTDAGIENGARVRVFHKGSLKDGMMATEIELIEKTPQI